MSGIRYTYIKNICACKQIPDMVQYYCKGNYGTKMKQETFTDIEYSFRKKKTKREEFLEVMDEIIPWDEWVDVIEPYYPKGKRGRPPMGIEKMLRM